MTDWGYTLLKIKSQKKKNWNSNMILKANSLPVTGRTLDTAHSTVCTTPEPIPAPEIASLHFILHIKHCTVHNRHLYFTLHTYQKLAEFKLMLLAEKWTLIYPVVRCMNYLPHCKSMDYWSLIAVFANSVLFLFRFLKYQC